MSRFLSLKKKKPTEKAELNKGDDNTKDKDYGSITSLINNEVKKTGKFRKSRRNKRKTANLCGSFNAEKRNCNSFSCPGKTPRHSNLNK